MAFIVYKGLENLLNNITELPQWVLNSHVVGGTVGKVNITFPVTFDITLKHQKVGAGGPWGAAGQALGGDFYKYCTAGPVAAGALQWCKFGAWLWCGLV